jgi:aspartyl-tRNA(Asn)/glutamyl-tRNA(Gln) amidotransferase subunit A
VSGGVVEYLPAVELLRLYATRELSPVEVVDAFAQRIEAQEGLLKAYAALRLDEARDEARAAERFYAGGEVDRPPLLGVPLAVKDLFDTADLQTTYGSPMFRGHIPAADAVAVRHARQAGAIVLGKTATHEFAWGITSYNAHFDWGRNPWATERVCGGSSGGSAVALAAGEATLALGSDTGGSIRAPAAFCGVVGLKPTYGRISTAGVFPLAPSLDHVGPMGRTPADVFLFHRVLASPGGSAVPAEDPQRLPGLNAGASGLRVGVSDDLVPVALSGHVGAAIESSLRLLEKCGARVVPVALPEMADVLTTFAAIQGAEALAVHRDAGLFPDCREDYGADVRGRLEAAEGISLERYRSATLARERLRAGFLRALEQADVLLTPVAAAPPVPRGEEEQDHLGARVSFRQLVLPFTTPQDLAGVPACALRAGFDEFGIPVGVQLTARPGEEATALRAAAALHDATGALQDRWPQVRADGTREPPLT